MIYLFISSGPSLFLNVVLQVNCHIYLNTSLEAQFFNDTSKSVAKHLEISESRVRVVAAWCGSTNMTFEIKDTFNETGEPMNPQLYPEVC